MLGQPWGTAMGSAVESMEKLPSAAQRDPKVPRAPYMGKHWSHKNNTIVEKFN